MSNQPQAKRIGKSWLIEGNETQAKWIHDYLINKGHPVLSPADAVNQFRNNWVDPNLEFKMRRAWHTKQSRERRKKEGFKAVQLSQSNIRKLNYLAKERGGDLNSLLTDLVNDPTEAVRNIKKKLKIQMDEKLKKKEQHIKRVASHRRRKDDIELQMKALTKFTNRLEEIILTNSEQRALLEDSKLEYPTNPDQKMKDRAEQLCKDALQVEMKVLNRVIRQLGKIGNEVYGSGKRLSEV